MNDLLGVLNDDEKERYLNGGYDRPVGGEYEGRDDHAAVSYTTSLGRGNYESSTVDCRGQEEEEASPRRMQQQHHIQHEQQHEVRVSVVTPNQKQQKQQGQNITTSTTIDESPTSIFSIFNCVDITNDISETLSLIFSPSPPKMTKNTPQQQQQRAVVVPEDDDEEERILMKKLQRLREKKWRGQSGGGSRSRVRT